jgi:DNA-binding SARP family transcriptional activator
VSETAATRAPILRVRLFGGLSIRRDDWPSSARLTRAAENLFSYLVLERKRSHARDELAGVFWGDVPDARARNCLNTALWRLRRILEPVPAARGMYIETTPSGGVRFNEASDYWLDVAVFEQALDALLPIPPEELDAAAAVRLESAAELYTGDLLAGVFDDWALGERERLRARHADALLHLMRVNRATGDVQKSLEFGRRILRDDPLREEVHRELMAVYQATGQPAQAIRQYEACRDSLLAALGISPEPRTRALRAALGPLADEDERPVPQVALRRAAQLLVDAAASLHEAERRLEEALRLVDEPEADGPRRPLEAVTAERPAGDRAVTGA